MTIISEIDNKIPTLCLNMICKNEAQIITRLFDSVINIIDCYCICDTGSTDNTPTVIEEYFKRKNIPGKIVYEKFIDFSYNRNFALKTIWQDDNYFNGRSMDVYIAKLRKYLKDDNKVEIINIHGKGFKLLVNS